MKIGLSKNIHVILSGLIAALFIPAALFAATLNLPKDSNGWTVFTPSYDSRICYIAADGDDKTAQYYSYNDAAVGFDPFKPVGNIKAYATFAAAYADTRTGYPDWILFKRGDTFTELSGLGTVKASGKDADEPFLIGSYGSSGKSPIIKTGTSGAITVIDYTQYLAFMGIDFYANKRDPNNNGSITAGKSGIKILFNESDEAGTAILFEGCKFRFYSSNSIQRNTKAGPLEVVIRRCTFSDNYGTSGHSQGLFMKLADNVIFEENILIHNGWYQQQKVSGEHNKSDGQATGFNHNIYWPSVKNSIIRRNISIDPSSSHIKLTGQYKADSHKIEDNLFLGGEVVVSMGHNYQGSQYAYRFPNVIIADNVASKVGRFRPTNRNLGWGFWLCGLDGASISNNLLINADSTVVNGRAFETNSDKSRNVTWKGNIAYNWGAKHGLVMLSGGKGSSNILFKNNKLQIPSRPNDRIIQAYYDVRNEWSFANNEYYADNQSFGMNGSTGDLSSWNSWSKDNSPWAQTRFPDSTRDIETYMKSIGENATIDAFIRALRMQDRYKWEIDYTADTVNTWIRAGFFGHGSSLSPPTTEEDNNSTDTDPPTTEANVPPSPGGLRIESN
jgi:hypothetical protein